VQIIFASVFISRSHSAFAFGQSGVTRWCLNPRYSEKFLNSSLLNGGPLSVLSVSGVPADDDGWRGVVGWRRPGPRPTARRMATTGWRSSSLTDRREAAPSIDLICRSDVFIARPMSRSCWIVSVGSVSALRRRRVSVHVWMIWDLISASVFAKSQCFVRERRRAY